MTTLNWDGKKHKYCEGQHCRPKHNERQFFFAKIEKLEYERTQYSLHS